MAENRQGFPLHKREENGERESREDEETVDTGGKGLALASEGETVLNVSRLILGSWCFLLESVRER